MRSAVQFLNYQVLTALFDSYLFSFKQMSNIIALLKTKTKKTKAKAPTKGDAKIAKVMGEFKKGTLNTGSSKGPKVTNPKQAIAIALSQARKVSWGRTKKKEISTDAPVHTGVMVAFYLDSFSPDAAVQLQIPGGETWDALHLTLAYLGDSTQLPLDAEGKLYELISQFAANQGPIEGEISGIGLFNTAEEGDSNAFYASFDSPGLTAFRQELMDLLQGNGLAQNQNHGFTPHITLAYIPKGQPIPNVTLPALPVIFDKVTVKWGDKRTDFTIGRTVKQTDPGGSFTVFKDKQGAWRWVAVSSSGFQDRDGETVSTRALAEDAARCDANGSYGPLDWWHTDVVIGNCDFNAMHGKLLVESGTFNNPVVAQRLAQAIASKEFEAGVSLQFRHREPGPHVLPGRVFKSIYKERRALLPMDAASNIATRLEVISPATTGQKSIEVYKVDAIKEQKLIELFGQDVAKEYLSKLAQKEQEFIQAGTAYKAVQVEMAEKAAAALNAPMDKTPVNAAPMAQAATAPAKTAKKDDLEGMLEPGGDNPMEEMAEPEGEGGDYEDGPTDQEADAIMETLFTRIGQIVTETVKAKVDEILSAVNGLGAASTKEIAAMEGIGIALKENASALTKVTGENTALKERVAVLESKLAALDGTQPAAVRARASQQQGLTFNQLNPALQQLVNKENQGQDPYQGDWTMQAAAQMTGAMAQRWQ